MTTEDDDLSFEEIVLAAEGLIYSVQNPYTFEHAWLELKAARKLVDKARGLAIRQLVSANRLLEDLEQLIETEEAELSEMEVEREEAEREAKIEAEVVAQIEAEIEAEKAA